MTASGSCDTCGKPAKGFKYTTPKEQTPGRHEGFWYCEDHAPTSLSAPKVPNRKERRAKERRRRGLSR